MTVTTIGNDGEWSLPGTYRHTQRGDLIILSVGGAAILIIASFLIFPPNLITVPVLLILASVLVSMAQLTVTVTGSSLAIRFGPVGLIHREWPLDTIVSARPVTTPWYYGYGIRWTPHGVLYNVSGSRAVEIQLTSGTRIRIGTDEPEAVVRALAKANVAIGTAEAS